MDKFNTAVRWRTSSHSNGQGNCVEVRDVRGTVRGTVLVRDTKDRESAVLSFGADAWNGLLADVRAGVLA